MSNILPESSTVDIAALLELFTAISDANRLAVNLIAEQPGITAGPGLAGNSTPRFVLASNDPTVTSLQALASTVVGGKLQVEDVDVSNVDVINMPEVDIDTFPFNIDNAAVTLKPTTNGGLSIGKVLDVDETEDAIKATAGLVYGWLAFNASGAIRYLKFYNATPANVTVGTTVPVMTIPIAAGGNSIILASIGIEFSTAITIAATTGLADNDSGAPGANDVTVTVFYK